MTIKQGHDFKGRHENEQDGKHTILGNFTIESRLNECLRQRSEVAQMRRGLVHQTDIFGYQDYQGFIMIQGCLTRKRPALLRKTTSNLRFKGYVFSNIANLTSSWSCFDGDFWWILPMVNHHVSPTFEVKQISHRPCGRYHLQWAFQNCME